MKFDALKTFTDWNITREEGEQHAVAVGMPVVSLIGDGRIFTRNAIKLNASNYGAKGKVNMLIAEMDGVFVYVQQGSIIVTKKELDL